MKHKGIPGDLHMQHKNQHKYDTTDL